MKWFSVSAITKEISKIRWPKKGDLASSSVQVIIFTAFFGLFFVLCQFLISVLLKGLGVM
ncbi:MAG: preprotein translocase subunit SecE [Erysipelotrichaceae bacterium]|nr:preprotein translocase subunit SecE [Erysipelotrichaceae bacterium]